MNGDTDSVKFLMSRANVEALEDELYSKFGQQLDRAKRRVCKRIEEVYPAKFDELEFIGHYVTEFESEYYCASWNKAYLNMHRDSRDGQMRCSFTLAGIPARLGVNRFAEGLYFHGWGFEQICNLMLGYNVTYSNSVIGLNARAFPEWGESVYLRVTDYQGNESIVAEPESLALYPMSKTVNDTAKSDNATNMQIALRNNPDVNIDAVLLHFKGDKPACVKDGREVLL